MPTHARESGTKKGLFLVARSRRLSHHPLDWDATPDRRGSFSKVSTGTRGHDSEFSYDLHVRQSARKKDCYPKSRLPSLPTPGLERDARASGGPSRVTRGFHYALSEATGAVSTAHSEISR